MVGAHGRLNKQKKHGKQKHAAPAKHAAKAAAQTGDPIALLSKDRRAVEQLFATYPEAKDKAEVARRICLELIVDTGIEEEIAAELAKRLSKPNQTEGEGSMPRNSNARERDEHGRFMSDEQHDYDRQGRRSPMRERDDAYDRFTGDEYDDRYMPRSRGNYDQNDRSRRDWNDRYSVMPPRDEQGRFVSDDSRRYDHDRGRDRQGWPTPPDYQDEGRRAWEEREGMRMRDRDGDWNEPRGWNGRGDQGWSGEWNEGRSRDRDRNGGREWGDGREWRDARDWSTARDSRNDRDWEVDRDRTQSRGNGGGRAMEHEGHGGWFGDPEGHAQAARRGWRDRR